MKPAPLFAQRGFKWLWCGQLLSITGDRLTYLALMGLLLEHSARPDSPSFATLLALFGHVVVAPVLLLAPFAGAAIDRMNLKRVVVMTDLLRALNVLAVPFAYGASPDIRVTFVLIFVLFALNVLFLPAKSAFVPRIVPPEQLLQANSHLAIAGIVATGAGALAGGYIVDRYGWVLAMQIDAATYLISVITLALIPYVSTRAVDGAPAGSVGYLREVGEGWREIRRNTGVLTCIVCLAAVWWAGGVLHVAGNPHVLASGHEPGMFQIGILLCVVGAGTALGTWWINTRGRNLSTNVKLGVGLVLAGAAVALFGSTNNMPTIYAAAFLMGTFAAPALILTETGLQQSATPERRARIFAGKDFLMRLTLLASVSVTAWLVTAVGTSFTLLTCAVITALIGGVLLLRQEEASGASAEQQ